MRKLMVLSLLIIVVIVIAPRNVFSTKSNLDNIITKEMAYEGVNNYCHNEYDWSIAEDNPSIMYLSMGEEEDNEYQVIFRGYTGAFLYFYVNKTNGNTKIVEYVPATNTENEVGTINLYDYLKNTTKS